MGISWPEKQNFKFRLHRTNGFRDIAMTIFRFFAIMGVAAKLQLTISP